MNEEVQERQTVTVGKPLVSKLNLHEPRPSSSTDSFFCQDSFNFAQCSVSTEDLIFSGSNPRPHCVETETKSQADAGLHYSFVGSNMPVESEAQETVDPAQPLADGKSLSHNYITDTKYKFSDMYNFHSY